MVFHTTIYIRETPDPNETTKDVENWWRGRIDELLEHHFLTLVEPPQVMTSGYSPSVSFGDD